MSIKESQVNICREYLVNLFSFVCSHAGFGPCELLFSNRMSGLCRMRDRLGAASPLCFLYSTLLLCCILSLVCAGSSPNLIKNPSFEEVEEGMATHWESLCGSSPIVETSTFLQYNKESRAALHLSGDRVIDPHCGQGVMQKVIVQQSIPGPLLLTLKGRGLDDGSGPFMVTLFLQFDDDVASEEIPLYFSGAPKWENRCISISPRKAVTFASVFISYVHPKGGALVDEVDLRKVKGTGLTAARDDECRSRCTFMFRKSTKCSFSDAFYLRSTNANTDHNDVTLSTAVSFDSLRYLSPLARKWGGRMSVAYYVEQPRRDLNALQELVSKEEHLKELVDFHVLYSSTSSGGLPTSMLVDVAMRHARTEVLLYSDIQYLPSTGLRHYLRTLIALNEPRHHRLYVIPDFDIIGGATVQTADEDELARLLSLEKADLKEAVEKRSLRSRLFTTHTANFESWMTAESPEAIAPSTSEVTFSSPILMRNAHAPERYMQRGELVTERYDIDSWMIFLAATGYTFHLLPDGFFIQSPDSAREQVELLEQKESIKEIRGNWKLRTEWLHYKNSKRGANGEIVLDKKSTDSTSGSFFSGRSSELDKKMKGYTDEIIQLKKKISESTKKLYNAERKLGQYSSTNKNQRDVCERQAIDLREATESLQQRRLKVEKIRDDLWSRLSAESQQCLVERDALLSRISNISFISGITLVGTLALVLRHTYASTRVRHVSVD